MADAEATTAPVEPQLTAPPVPVEQQPVPGPEVNGTVEQPTVAEVATAPAEPKQEMPTTQPEAVIAAETAANQFAAADNPIVSQSGETTEQPVPTEQIVTQPVSAATETVVAMDTAATTAAEAAAPILAKGEVDGQQDSAAVAAAVEAAATAEIDAAAVEPAAVVAVTPTTTAAEPSVDGLNTMTEHLLKKDEAAHVPPVTPQEENEELRRMISELKDQLAKRDEEIEKLKSTGPKRKKARVGPKLNPDGTPVDPGTPSKKMEVQKQKRDEVWKARYNELVAYKLQNGDTNVPTKNYKPNPQLAHWVHTQRTRRRAWDAGKAGAGDLTQERIDALDSIGFQWNPGRRVNDDLWEQRFNELCEFKRENGHTNVPEKYAPNKSLGKWVSNQRHRRKLLDAGKKAKGMTRARVEKLDAVGFEWTK